MSKKPPNFRKNIFINCPFDEEYKPLLRSLLFAVIDCGFEPRIATERNDSAEVRLKKILNLMRESCYSIHDIPE
jgi:tyrosine-protein phosphatase YwqE